MTTNANSAPRLRNQDIDDIEDGVVAKNCFNCRQPQQKYVLMMPYINAYGEPSQIRSKNYIGVCTNPKCFRSGDLRQSPSWVKA